MNRSKPFRFATESGKNIWIFHMIRIDELGSLSGIYHVIVSIEASLILLISLIIVYFIYYASRYPPVHLNLVIITIYSICMLSISCLGRVGQILYEAGLVGERGLISTPLFVCSHIRLTGLAMVARYAMAIYCERCLALRFVRDYERNRRLYISAIYIVQDLIVSNAISWILMSELLPGYPTMLVTIITHALFHYLIKQLLRENKIRLDNLNSRDIRRPLINSRTQLIPSKFYGDSSKDMYTLSLRLQLDENIWCCKQLTQGNDVIMYAFALVVTIFAVPPLIPYTEDTEWILHLLVMLANVGIPVSALTVAFVISWSLDKLRPLVYPARLVNWASARKNRKISFIPLVDAQSRFEEETDEYFDQLSEQWDRSYDFVNAGTTEV